jgi:hypothetical protein
MAENVHAPGDGEPGLALCLLDPHADDFGSQLAPIVRVDRPRTTKVADRFECFEKTLRTGDRLSEVALYDVLVLLALLPVHGPDRRESLSFEIHVQEVESNTLAAAETPVARKQNEGMDAWINLARSFDDALVGLVIVVLGWPR